MNFDVYGPYPLPRDKHIISRDKKKRRKFWDDKVNNDHPQLSKACGCYVFLVGKKAWYIGKTDKSFEKECLQPHKTELYAEALQNHKSKPRLILVASLTKKDRFTAPRKRKGKRGLKSIDLLEKLLIFVALQHNKELLNSSNTAKLRKMNVPGFTNSRRGQGRATAVQALKRAIGL